MKHINTLFLGSVIAIAGTAWAQTDDTEIRGLNGNFNVDFQGWVGMAAQPGSHTAQYVTSGGTSSYNCVNSEPGGSRSVRYPFTLPDSRYLEFVRVWGDKLGNTADLELSLIRSCMSQNDVDPVTSTLDSMSVTGAPGAFSALLGGDVDTPNNLDCRYWLAVEFGSPATACATGGVLRITKIRTHGTMYDRIFRGTFHHNSP